MPDSESLATLKEILNWVRVGAYPTVKHLLEEALPDAKSRQAYQMTDGSNGSRLICRVCKIGKNTLPALQARCVALGLMADADGRKMRIFDLASFGMLEGDNAKISSNGD